MTMPYGPPAIGPRTAALRTLRGEEVPTADVVTDLSEFGIWREGGPLEHRPPELWVDLIHDACGEEWQ